MESKHQSFPWGSIEDVVNSPPTDVPPDASWVSVCCMCITFPLNLLQAIVGGIFQCAFLFYSVGCWCFPPWMCCSAMGSVFVGRPCILAPSWWRYILTGLVALLKNGRSRLSLFIWEWKAFGKTQFWWHGEGFWAHTYEDCNGIVKSNQRREAAFGCVRACVPDLFATNILIFLSNDSSESEWAAIRWALHTCFLNASASKYQDRVAELGLLLGKSWVNPKVTDFNDTFGVRRAVSKCIFYVMFGIWLEDREADILAGWRSNASLFILPRLAHRFLLNFGIKKVKKLRIDTIGIIEAHGLQQLFHDMNNDLPAKYRRTSVVKLCDEIMFAVGFAGVGGTCACVESVGAFLQAKKPEESAANRISFQKYPTSEAMVTAYHRDPISYIKETCRLDPPVTSCTQAISTARIVRLNGTDYNMKEGTLNQYVISMANRDPQVFPEPDVFDPQRSNLNSALTWNGAFGTQDDEITYPRLCPGRYLSLDVSTTIINHVLSSHL